MQQFQNHLKIVKDDTLTIFLNNLPFTVTEDMIRNKLILDVLLFFNKLLEIYWVFRNKDN